jgi:hypothetical protein
MEDRERAMLQKKNAKTHLEYAIQEGGSLYVVEDARRMLAELTQTEQCS